MTTAPHPIVSSVADTSRQPRFVLGTAQLGMTYGIANRSGKPSQEIVDRLIGAAVACGFHDFDTAQAYGESEAVLGRSIAALGVAEAVTVITKGKISGASLAASIAGSQARLGVRQLGAWLLHDEKELLQWSAEVAKQADAVLSEGLVRLFGVSVYHPDPALRAVEELGLKAIQFPANPFDRRFLRPNVMGRFAATGARIDVRSIYLQGLCLMAPSQVPPAIPHGARAVRTLHDFCAARGIAADRFCLHYVLQRTAAASGRVVVGVDNVEQLERNANLLSQASVSEADMDAWDAIWPEDFDDLIFPYRWPVQR